MDDRDRSIPAIVFREVVLAFDDRVILNRLSFKVLKGETKIILGGSGGGSGLGGMRERLRLYDGQLELHSAPGAGTRLRAVVPLQSA